MRARAGAHWFLPLIAATLASIATVAADSRWLAALGATIAHGSLPRQLPFAAAPTRGWHNVPVVAELVFHALEATAHDRGLIAAQVVAVAIGFGSLAVGLARESSPGAALLVGIVVLLGSLPAVLLVRNELFSLALLPVLLLILEGNRERLWLVVPLLAVWSNLHGSVLVGLALVVVYVLFERRGAWPLLVLAPLGVCVTPQLWRTPLYYYGVTQNEAAKLGVGLWQPLGLTLFGDLLIAAFVLLLLAAVAGRRSWSRWEVVAVLGLAVATVHAERFGTWLLFVLAYPAARALVLRPLTVPALSLTFLLPLIVAGVASGHPTPGRALALRAASTGQTVLAEPLSAEEVELAGGKVWVGDPLDAFPKSDQLLYLKWSEGKAAGRAAVAHASLVLVRADSAAGRVAATDTRLHTVARADGFALYRVVAKARR